MAFGLKYIKKNGSNDAPIEEHVEEELEISSNQVNHINLDFLEPKKNAKKDSINDPYREELTEKSAYQYTLKTLNALKIISPIISALLQRPGAGATNEEMTESFKKLISQTSEISQKICEKLNIDPNKERNFWIRNVLEKCFAEILKDQWIVNGSSDLTQVHSMIDSVIEYRENVAEKGQYEELTEDTLVKLATIKCMLPIIQEANKFNLYRDFEQDIENIMTVLYNTSKIAVEKLADDYAKPQERAKLFFMIMQEAGELYASAWSCESNRVKNIMTNYPKEKLEGVLDKYKKNGGIPLDNINKDFDKYFNKMIIITEKLVISQKGSIQNRLGK